MGHGSIWEKAIIGIAFAIVSASASNASPVTYTFDGTGSVTLGGVALGNPLTGIDKYSIVFTGDTTAVDLSGSPFIRYNNITGTFTDGAVTETITATVESNSSLANIDFYDTTFTNGLGFADAALAGFELITSIGPITAGSGELTPTFGGGVFATAGGDLQFTSSDSLSFTASVSTTPLPATLPLFATGLGGLSLLGWRRKRKAQAAA
jgi:hypothetical protein